MMESMDIGETTTENSCDQFEVPDDERCGICMEEVIDRGVLDCCSHWFCFSCIDNWAIITNLCPLCKAQFEIITCVPVYDTRTACNKQSSISTEANDRDENWFIHGKNNALSFPSYYIDENAILCLEGNDCKIKAGHTAPEDLSYLDTSVACDSCDIWYHAVCVQFNPDSICEDKWFCPRCKNDDALADKAVSSGTSENKSCFDAKLNTDNLSYSKMQVHVTDTGETAVIVSRVENQDSIQTAEKSINDGFVLASKPDAKVCTTQLYDDCIADPSVKQQLEQKEDTAHSMASCQESEALKNRNGMLAYSGPYENDHTTDTALYSEVIDTSSLNHLIENRVTEDAPMSPILLPNEGAFQLESFCIEKGPDNFVFSENGKAVEDKHLEGEEGNNVTDKNVIVEDEVVEEHIALQRIQSFSKKRNYEEMDRNIYTAASHGSQYGLVESVQETDSVLKKATSVNSDMKHHSKSAPAHNDKSDNVIKSVDTVSSDVEHWHDSDDVNGKRDVTASKKQLRQNITREADSLKRDLVDEDISSQLMALVRRPKPNSTKFSQNYSQGLPTRRIQETSLDVSENSSKSLELESVKKDQINAVRIKKIVPGRSDAKTSSLVNEIKKELRIATGNVVQDSHSKIDVSDERLLAAFKAAMTKARELSSESYATYSQSSNRHKKPKLGTVRNNLTKKLYGVGNGKRRHSWDRIWELEFWKGRCDKEKQLKKYERSDSVTELLQTNLQACSKTVKSKDESKSKGVDPILSRLYLADNSVFPRKGDLKPLASQFQSGSMPLKKSDVQAAQAAVGEIKNEKHRDYKLPSSALNHVSNNQFEKDHRQAEESHSGNSHVGSQSLLRDTSANIEDTVENKRKWALEVLARKTSSNVKKTETSVGDKDKFPLQSQLPSDMLPVLSHNHKSKVPIAVRQMQLNRLIEYYLKMANLQVIRRTADTEFAVADAVNKEKEIYERSNSKNVYINLCAQALSQRVCMEKTVEKKFESCEKVGMDTIIEEALKATGLISESPPGSPYQITTDISTELDKVPENTDSLTADTENVLYRDCDVALDIYRDFEYSLNDQKVPGPSKKSSNARCSEHSNDAASELKVLLSGSHNSDIFEDQTNHCEGVENSCPKLMETDSKKIQPVADIKCLTKVMSQPILENREVVVTGDDHSLDTYQESETTAMENAKCDFVVSDISDSVKMTNYQDNILTTNGVTDEFKCETSSYEQQAEFLHSNNQCGYVGDALSSAYPFTGGNKGDAILDDHIIPENEESVATNYHQASKSQAQSDNRTDKLHAIGKKVEAYVKEHIRPLCKSGIVSVDQYRWAVRKTVDKVMNHHQNAKNADFLIPEGDKVKKLSEQYLQAFKQKRRR